MRIFLCFLLLPLYIFGKSPEMTNEDLNSTPPKIIRTCCSFGNELKLVVLPFIKFTDITSFELLGSHHYLGDESEMNGIIYTHRGGFIDVGHIRDIADWTGYLYNVIKNVQKDQNPNFELKLGYEGGSKKLVLNIPSNFSDEDAIILAGKIAYDISVWHEISTWYGNSYIPFIKERYSAFSVEDAYSNLMGAHVGMEAIRSYLPFEEAVTQILYQKLIDLEPVNSYEETSAAMDKVKDIWWTDKASMPSGKVLMKREFIVYGDSLYPRLLPNETVKNPKSQPIYYKTNSGKSLDDYYEIRIKLNYKFPLKKINLTSFNSKQKRKYRTITQRDFQSLIYAGTSRNKKKYPIDLYQF